MKIETQGACDQRTLFNILLKAASSGDSIENTAKTLAAVPCGNNIRYHLDKINNFEQLESELNLALKSRLPCGIRNKQHSFLKGRRSYKTTYTMKRNSEDFVDFDLWIVCKYKKGKRRQRGVEYLAYVIYKVKVSLSYLHQTYRQRFGIESSYRLKNLSRIRTTTKKPVLRLLFVGISFLLVNIWVNLLWQKISLPRRGSRLIYRHFFGFKQMLCFLRQAD